MTAPSAAMVAKVKAATAAARRSAGHRDGDYLGEWLRGEESDAERALLEAIAALEADRDAIAHISSDAEAFILAIGTRIKARERGHGGQTIEAGEQRYRAGIAWRVDQLVAAEAERARLRGVVEAALATDPEIAASDDAVAPVCHRCGGHYTLGDRDRADHGMCWPCASEALDTLRAALASGAT